MAKKAYLGLDWIVSLILAIIPITNIVLGIVTRLERNTGGKAILLAVLNFFLCFVFYWVDLVSIIVNKDIKWLDKL